MLHLRSTVSTSLGVAVIGLAAYAVYKSGLLRKAAVGVIRGGVKASAWAEDRYKCARDNVKGMVEEARKEPAPCPVTVKEEKA